jgi:hypothetical protein
MEERPYPSERLGERPEAEGGPGGRSSSSSSTTRTAIELGIQRTVSAFLDLIDEPFYQWLHGRPKEGGTEEGGGEEGGQEATSTEEGDLNPEGDSSHPRPIY